MQYCGEPLVVQLHWQVCGDGRLWLTAPDRDIDYYTAIPNSFDIQQVAGPKSRLTKKS